MGVSQNKRWNQVRNTLQRNARNAVARSAAIVVAVGKAELSKQGTGRFYARSKATKAIARQDTFELSERQVTKILERENRRIANVLLRRTDRARIGNAAFFTGRKTTGGNIRMRPLRALGVHRASAPGHPPAPDSGLLMKSWQADLSRLNEPNPRARVGTNLNYAKKLEYGGRHLAARPFARPTAKKARPKIAAQWRATTLLRGAVQTVSGGGGGA